MKRLLLFITLIPSLIIGQLPLKTYLNIDRYLTRVSHFGFTGGFGMADPDTRFLRGYGIEERSSGQKFTADLATPIASISKTFTAFAILKLYSEQKLELNDPLSKWLPGVPADKSAITIHQLMTHTSGLPGDFFTAPGVKYDSLLRGIFALPLKQKGKWSYSNAGYGLLALIVEKASGISYQEYLKKEVFWPLGLNSTGFISEKYMPAERFAHSYNRDLKFSGAQEQNLLAESIGATDIVSDLEDLLRWAAIAADSNTISKAIFTLQHTAHAPVTPQTAYGYGWYVEAQKDGSVSYRHGGNVTPTGITLELRNYPALKINYILTCTQMNEESPLIRIPRTEITKMIADSAYVPALTMIALDENRKIDATEFTKGGVRISLYHANGRNYMEAEGQRAINSILSFTAAQVVEAENYNAQTATAIDKLKAGVFGSENFVVQNDWKLFESLNGKIGDCELLGTISTDQNQWVTFFRCHYKNNTRVVRFLWEKGRLRYIAQNDNYAPRWCLLNLSASPQEWLGYDLTTDKSFQVVVGKGVKIGNEIFN